MFKDLGINEDEIICDGAILLCLVCYMSSKILIYCFLVEKVYIIRGSRIPRMRDPLYLFNCFGMLLPYTVVVILNFVWRISYKNEQGMCIIGMEKKAMMPLIIFDVVVNVYLTSLFLLPLRQLYSYRERTNKTLRRMAVRTFFGSCATLTSSVTNLTILMVLVGEPGWICLMCCNADILFSVIVLHWVTSFDSAGRQGSSLQNNSRGSAGGARGAFNNKLHPQPSGDRRSTTVPSKTGRDGVDFDLGDEEEFNSSLSRVERAHMSWNRAHPATSNPNANGATCNGYDGWNGAKATVHTQCEAVPINPGEKSPHEVVMATAGDGDYRLDRIVVTKEQTREVEVEEVDSESRSVSASGSGRSSSDRSQSPLKRHHQDGSPEKDDAV
ncbi:uncharacterized protein J3D65DRAFT_677818 [Phyllosticta citribraziliensis]|uniref:Uncharacterized protein n=1 Tax=Phyllosticta citribraziliensis TaxID=989973 RepID=A0ABR1LN19_9PEZI